MREEVSFHMFLKKDDPKLPRKKKVSSHQEEEEAPVELVSKVEEQYYHFFYQVIEIVVNCTRNRFQQKNLIETLQTIETLPLEVLREEDFVYKCQQTFSFFSSGLCKIKIKDPTKTFDPYC